jgi:hypothetical protein
VQNMSWFNVNPLCSCTFCYFLIQNGPRKSSPGPQHSIDREINTVAKCKCKRKSGYFSWPILYVMSVTPEMIN